MSDEDVVGPVYIQHHVEASELRLIRIHVDQTTPGEAVDHEGRDRHLIDRRQAARSTSRQPQLARERDSLSVLVAYQKLLIRQCQAFERAQFRPCRQVIECRHGHLPNCLPQNAPTTNTRSATVHKVADWRLRCCRVVCMWYCSFASILSNRHSMRTECLLGVKLRRRHSQLGRPLYPP